MKITIKNFTKRNKMNNTLLKSPQPILCILETNSSFFQRKTSENFMIIE